MNRVAEYRFDFSQPDRIRWNARDQKDRDVEVPEHSVNFVINDSTISNSLQTVIDSRLADALDVAVAVHMADRLALRERWVGNSRVPVHRSISMKVAVRTPELWQDRNILGKVTDCLEFLTQDTWDLRFTNREFGRPSDTQERLFPPNLPENPDVFLFSGGLDSFCGSAILMEPDSERFFIAVSASPTNIHRAWQKQQFSLLLDRFQKIGSHLSVQYAMVGGAKTLQEPTRRSRAFAFLLMGAAAALSAGSDRLRVFENGIGAINLPYDLSQIGVDHTRAMHPKTLRLVSDLISQLMGKPFAIRNGCLAMTKADMCRHPALTRISDGIRLTYSCDGLTRDVKHCGFCTSCLLRIHSLEAAGRQTSDHGQYLSRVFDSEWKGKRHQLRGLHGMTWQALRIRKCLESKNPWQQFVREFPELHEISMELEIQSEQGGPAQLLGLYQTHVSDWLKFSGLRHLAVAA